MLNLDGVKGNKRQFEIKIHDHAARKASLPASQESQFESLVAVTNTKAKNMLISSSQFNQKLSSSPGAEHFERAAVVGMASSKERSLRGSIPQGFGGALEDLSTGRVTSQIWNYKFNGQEDFSKDYIGLKLEAERLQDAIIAAAIHQAEPVDIRDDPFNLIKRSKLAHRKDPPQKAIQQIKVEPIRIMESKLI
jgi:hypothetical protein